MTQSSKFIRSQIIRCLSNRESENRPGKFIRQQHHGDLRAPLVHHLQVHSGKQAKFFTSQHLKHWTTAWQGNHQAPGQDHELPGVLAPGYWHDLDRKQELSLPCSLHRTWKGFGPLSPDDLPSICFILCFHLKNFQRNAKIKEEINILHNLLDSNI